jgi:hypothetical protein
LDSLISYFWYFWLTIQNTASRQVRNLFYLVAVFISFPWRKILLFGVKNWTVKNKIVFVSSGHALLGAARCGRRSSRLSLSRPLPEGSEAAARCLTAARRKFIRHAAQETSHHC